MMSKILKIFGSICAVFVLLLSGVYLSSHTNSVSEGSVSQGSEYHATTTKSFNGTALPQLSLLATGSGTLGSIVVTGATAGQTINIYDATTSDATQRTLAATSTLALITSTTLAGTYTFDVTFFRGLLLEVIGATGTSTITFRNQ